MPQELREAIYVDLDKVVATEITKITKFWSLGEVLDAAGVPADVEIMAHRDDRYDGPMTMHRAETVCRIVMYEDKQGRPLKRVTRPVERTVIQTIYEETYEPVPTPDSSPSSAAV